MPKEVMAHDYYYGNEAEQYIFYRLPKALFTNNYYARVSDSAKILYGLMLDRMGLSIKNRWLDEKGRVFIYYTLDDLQEAMRCGHNKGVKIVSELERVGLIERVKQGQGKPAIIYVKRFITDSNSYISRALSTSFPHHHSQENPDFRKAELQTSDNGKSRLPQNGSADFRKAEGNNTKYNQNDLNDIHSIHSIPGGLDADECRQEIRHRLDYYAYLQDPYEAMEQLDELIELMVEIQCTSKSTIHIAGTEFPTELVKQRFSKLTGKHIEYVLNSFKENSSTIKIRNIKQYLLTIMFNAPAIIEHSHAAEFNRLYYGAVVSREN